MRVLVILSFFSFLFISFVTAQNRSVKAIKAEIENAKVDTNRIKLLSDLVDILADRGEMTAADKVLTQTKKLADSLNYSYGRQLVHLNQANLYLLKGQPDSARYVMETALERYSESPLSKSYYSFLGTALRFQGKNEQALKYYNKAIALSDSTKDLETLASVKQSMAVAYENLSQKTKAMRHYLEGLEYAETTQDTTFLATLVNNIGEAYTDYKEYDKAEYYLQRSLNLSEAIGFKVGLLRASLNLANVRNNIGEYDAALDLYRQALDLSAQVRPGQPPVRINHNLGRLYLGMGELDKAKKYLQQSLSESETLKLSEGIYYNSRELGKVASAKDQITEAIEWNDRALLAAKELKSAYYQKEIQKELYTLSKKQENYQQAVEYLEAFQTLSDSLWQLESDQTLAEYEAKLNVHRQAEINELLEAKQKEQEARLNTQQWLIVSGLLVTVLALIIVVVLIRTNKVKKAANDELQAQKQELEQLNAVKDKLFAIVAHDLRSPMAGLKGILNLFRNNSMSTEELRTLFAQLEVSMQQNLNSMENLLKWAQQQMDGIIINMKLIFVKPIIDEILESHRFYAQQKGIELVNKVSENIKVLADPDLVELVLRNLISNALKFSDKGDEVAVRATFRDDCVLFSVEDTGIGIPESQQEAIFQFGNKVTRRGTNNEHGSGLGLNLCKEFIERQKGSMSFESEEGKGTVFYFSLPIAS